MKIVLSNRAIEALKDAPATVQRAFSKKIENHAASIAVHHMHYNFCRLHQTSESRLRWHLASPITFGNFQKLWDRSIDEYSPRFWR
jgi:hypothetical protein